MSLKSLCHLLPGRVVHVGDGVRFVVDGFFFFPYLFFVLPSRLPLAIQNYRVVLLVIYISTLFLIFLLGIFVKFLFIFNFILQFQFMVYYFFLIWSSFSLLFFFVKFIFLFNFTIQLRFCSCPLIYFLF
jgi:hypothetical protein